MKLAKIALLSCTTLYAASVMAEDLERGDKVNEEIVVTGFRIKSDAGTKTDTPVIQTPQPVTVITDDVFSAQGALSISETLRYVAGVQANSYGPDSRVDGGFVRGLNPLQFRDGMRDLFSYYASIRSDPYNFSQVQVIRGPASVLFGQGTLGGLINMVSKTPEFETKGEISARYGSFDNKELLGDINGKITENLAARFVTRLRNADTQTDYVRDNRVLLAPSATWKATDDTDVTLIGMYQKDKSGSTAQFLPLVGTILPNPTGKLRSDLFIGKPGWDRYDGRLLQGTGIIEHRFTDNLKINVKARYIDSNLTYFTHYPNSYSNPANPYTDTAQRMIGLYADGSYARMNVFSTDNNIQWDFNTGENIRHVLLGGVDYSWNRVRKEGGLAYESIDIYNINYASLLNYNGGIPTAAFPNFIFGSTEDTAQKQTGIYVQDQIRFYDRVSVVLGARRDHVLSQGLGVPDEKANNTSFRAGVIAEVVKGVSPFFSYTEAFEPISGALANGNPFKPKQGRQYEAGIKFHPSESLLITATAYHIKESNRPIDDASTPNPNDQIQAGSSTSKGFELEGRYALPNNFDILVNYSFVEAEVAGSGHQLENVPKNNASIWTTKTFAVAEDTNVRLGAGVRYTSQNYSFGDLVAFPTGIRTPSFALVDALAEVNWRDWSFTVNATNLFNKEYYSACLARGDCFNGTARNIFGTLTYRF